MDTIGPLSYCALNGLLDAAYPKGALNYWKSNFVTGLSDLTIDAIIDSFERCPASMSAILLEHFHGALTRIPVTQTAFAHRQAGYNCAVLGEWMDSAETDECIAWVRSTHDRLLPHMTTGRYVNYLGDDETADAVAAAYGSNFERLQEIKKRYDPENVFHLNQNISPAA